MVKYPSELNYEDFRLDCLEDENLRNTPIAKIDISKHFAKFKEIFIRDRHITSIEVNLPSFILDVFLFMVEYGIGDYNAKVSSLRREEYLEDLLNFLNSRLANKYQFEHEPMDSFSLLIEDNIHIDSTNKDQFISTDMLNVVNETFNYMFNIVRKEYENLVMLVAIGHLGYLIDNPLRTELIGYDRTVQIVCLIYADMYKVEVE